MWLNLLLIFITSILLPKVGFVMAKAQNLSLIETILSVGGGGSLGGFVFTYIFDNAIHWFNKKMDKWNPARKKKKKIFTWKSRMIIKVKRYFGIVGIATISPVLISIPLGAFLGVRFFGDRRKVVLWIAISCAFWSIVLFYLLEPLRKLWSGS
jgi:hypothetical protein